MKLEIAHLLDSYDCETCGTAYAEGFRVLEDGEIFVELEPLAHCFGGSNYDYRDLFFAVMGRLGIEVEDPDRVEEAE
jgi:hypothetical protein